MKPTELNSFYQTCIKELNLNIIGLMCIPPNNTNTNIYFSEMKKLKSTINVTDLSMGMSQDYLKAIEYDATYIRIGSKIFGSRV